MRTSRRVAERRSPTATFVALLLLLGCAAVSTLAYAHHPVVAAAEVAVAPSDLRRQADALDADVAPIERPASLRAHCPGRSSPWCGCGTATPGASTGHEPDIADARTGCSVACDVAPTIVPRAAPPATSAGSCAPGALGARAPPPG